MSDTSNWLDQVRWDDKGLVAVVAQDAADGRVLTLAYMNRAALEATVSSGEVTYWSRSRQRLWRKGESSGHVQKVREVRLDCDGDALLVVVEQLGGIACHTGRHSCFFNRIGSEKDGRNAWIEVDPVLRDPKEIYK